jgi:hypothetical protein
MRYTVVWSPPAEAALARLWMAAPDQNALADAANRIDRALLNDPETKGTSFGRFYVREERPLSVLYEVVPDDRMVIVWTVKTIT